MESEKLAEPKEDEKESDQVPEQAPEPESESFEDRPKTDSAVPSTKYEKQKVVASNDAPTEDDSQLNLKEIWEELEKEKADKSKSSKIS